MSRTSIRLILIIFAAMVTIPYLVAAMNAGNQHIFGGFFLNPEDGNSYLAKMEEGRRGEWRFTLPFTAVKSEGAYLFLFYILLGHIARITTVSPVLIFHFARIIGALFLFFSLYQFTLRIFTDHAKTGGQAFLLSLFGSGIGWLFLLAGQVTSDLWVAETYPFLSGFATPHFSIGMGILLWMLLDIAGSISVFRIWRLAILGLLLAIIMPFGIVVVGCVGLIWTLSEWRANRQLDLRAIVAAMSLGGPFLLYQYASIQQDPLLAVWNNQNLTRSPPVWDLIAALSPAIFFAVLGILGIIKTSGWNRSNRLLVIWFVVGAAMIYFPFSLQRRFMFSFFIPVSCLAVTGIGLPAVRKFFSKVSGKLFPALFALSVITNGFVILLAIFGIMQKSPLYYISSDEMSAFNYLKSANAADAVVLCSPEIGNLIPGWTGLRVIYGHEFETIHASENQAVVKDIFSGRISPDDITGVMRDNQVRFVFVGPRERELGDAKFLINREPIYRNGSVEIYSW